MKKIFILSLLLIAITSAGGNRLNPEWYPNGAGKDIVYTVGNGKFSLPM